MCSWRSIVIFHSKVGWLNLSNSCWKVKSALLKISPQRWRRRQLLARLFFTFSFRHLARLESFKMNLHAKYIDPLFRLNAIAIAYWWHFSVRLPSNKDAVKFLWFFFLKYMKFLHKCCALWFKLIWQQDLWATSYCTLLFVI